MSWMKDNIEGGPFCFGSDAERNIFVFGDMTGRIEKVYIDGEKQFAHRDFLSALHRFGSINGLAHRDYQQAVHVIFGPSKPW